MIGAMTHGRLRSVCAVVVVSGLLLSLFTLCCCLNGPAPSGAREAAGTASVRVSQAGVTGAEGHLDLDCGRPSTPDVVVSKIVAHGVLDVSVSVVRADVPAPPVAVPPSETRLWSPAPHLLCVMRT